MSAPNPPRRPWWRRLLVALVRIVILLAAILALLWFFIAQPTFRHNDPSPEQADLARLRETVRFLAVDCFPRCDDQPENLRRAADRIARDLADAGAEVSRQPVPIGRDSFDNVIGTIGRGRGRKLVVGAHYDAVPETPGADDNASGVAGLLELARLIARHPPDREVELVAYTHEEPPYFATDAMGSHVHARAIARSGEPVAGVIVLEMIGHFSDQPASQSYPIPMLHLMYPTRGNFIAVVGALSQRPFTKRIKTGMKGATQLPVFSINAPKSLPGIDFSDHRNYWLHDLQAVMITDTAFYRNQAYHLPQDTPDRLDYRRMAQVVVAVHAALDDL